MSGGEMSSSPTSPTVPQRHIRPRLIFCAALLLAVLLARCAPSSMHAGTHTSTSWDVWPKASPLLRAAGKLRLRGGFAITERIIEARMEKAREEVAKGWFAQNSSDILPFHTWEAVEEQARQQAPHVGFMAGTGHWIGPSWEQAEKAEMVDESITYGGADPMGEKRDKWLEFLGGKDGVGPTGMEDGEGGAKSKGEFEGWGVDDMDEYDRLTAAKGSVHEMEQMAEQSGWLEGGRATPLLTAAKEVSWTRRREALRRRSLLQHIKSLPHDGESSREGRLPARGEEEGEVSNEKQGEGAAEVGGARGRGTEGGEERESTLLTADERAAKLELLPRFESEEEGEEAEEEEVRRPRGEDLFQAPVLAVERTAKVGDIIDGPTPLAGENGTAAASRKPLKVLAVEEKKDFFAEGVGLKFEVVASDSSGGPSSDVDLRKYQPSSATSDDYADVAAQKRLIQPTPFPQHGNSMANSYQPDLTTPQNWSSPMLATVRWKGPKPKQGVREADLRAGGKLFEAARRLHGTLVEGMVYRFPKKAEGQSFVLDPKANALVEYVEELEDASSELAWEDELRVVAREQLLEREANATPHGEEEVESEEEAKASAAREEAASLGRGWTVESALNGTYMRYQYLDGQKFYDRAEAQRYANLTSLEKMEYAVQRLTVMGDPDASYASVDLKDQIPVFSSVAAQWGQYKYMMQNLVGPLPMEQKEFQMMTRLTNYFQHLPTPPPLLDVLGGKVLLELRRVSSEVHGIAAEMGPKSPEFVVAEEFIEAINASTLDVNLVATLVRFGMPELGSVLDLERRRADVHRMRSQLWKVLLGVVPADKEQWEARAQEWRTVHERMVLELCKEAEHDPWELFEDYDVEGQEGTVAEWSEEDVGGVGGFGSMDWVMEDLAAAEGVKKGMKPAVDERWHRLWGNPSAVLGPNGTVAARRVAFAEMSTAERWREMFAARALWDDIAYDTYNGTYPHLHSLTPEDRPADGQRLEELRWKEEDGTLTRKEAEELWWAQEMHYDCVFGVYPLQYLPEDLQHLTTRLIFTYIRLHPTVAYSPDMHALLAPVLWLSLRDPDQGARDSLIHREKSVKHRRLDAVEAIAFQLFHALASQVFQHWQPDPASGLGFVERVAVLVRQQLLLQDAEMASNLFDRLQIDAQEFVPAWVSRLFADQFPLWLLLPLWESVLSATDREARVAAICCAMAATDAGRAPLIFAGTKDEALLLLRWRPAMDVDQLLLASERFLGPPSHTSFSHFAASLSSRRELRSLRRWGRACVPRDQWQGQRITHVPFVNADGSAGFRKVQGGGFGYGICPSKGGRRAATRFSKSKEVVPRLRLCGSDARAPLNFSALIEHFPPVPNVDWSPGQVDDASSDGGQEQSGVGLGGSEDLAAGGAEADFDADQIALGRGGSAGATELAMMDVSEGRADEEDDSSLLSAGMRREEEEEEEEEDRQREGGMRGEQCGVEDDGEDEVGDVDEESSEVVFPGYRYCEPVLGSHDVDVRVHRQQLRADEFDAKREELRKEDEKEQRDLFDDQEQRERREHQLMLRTEQRARKEAGKHSLLDTSTC